MERPPRGRRNAGGKSVAGTADPGFRGVYHRAGRRPDPVGSIRATTLALFCAFVLRSAAAAEADCRELDRNYTIAKPSITSVQLNATLFASAAKDCGAFGAPPDRGRRFVAGRATGAGRDGRLLMRARGGHAALVARLLAEGGGPSMHAISTAPRRFYAAAEAERPTTVAALLAKGADPNLTGRKQTSRRSPPPRFAAMTASSSCCSPAGADADHGGCDRKDAPHLCGRARGFALVVHRPASMPAPTPKAQLRQ